MNEALPEDLAAAEREALYAVAQYAQAVAVGVGVTEPDEERAAAIQNAIGASASISVSVLIPRDPMRPIAIGVSAHAQDGTRTPLALRQIARLQPQTSGPVQ